MAVAFGTVGTVAGTDTEGNTVAPGDPSGLASGQIQVLIEVVACFGTGSVVSTFPTVPTGFTTINEGHQAGSGSRNVRMRVSWAAWDATAPTPATNTDGSGMAAGSYIFQAVRFSVTGVDTSDPVDVSAVTDVDSTSISATGVTTTVANTLVAAIFAQSDENAVSAQTFTDPSSGTEHLDDLTTLGGDQGINIWSGTKSTAGATGNYTATTPANDPGRVLVVAFQEPQVTASGGGLLLLGVG